MNLRHAVALALVGWYLIQPPVGGPADPPDKWIADVDAPISRWETVLSFDKASECESERLAVSNRAGKLMDKYIHLRKPVPPPVTASINAKCIATDDPRLKEK